MSAEIKPCPFCGAEARTAFVFGDLGRDPGKYIACTRCGARGPEVYPEQDEVTPWNTRTRYVNPMLKMESL